MNQRNQYLATICANILTIAHGIACGWPSPNLPRLTTDDSLLPSGKIDISEASSIAALLCAGGLVGNFTFAWITNRYGRKYPLMLVTIPLVTSWLMILYAQDVNYLYAGRILCGFSGGGVFVITPLYVAEIAEDQIRGFLGSFLILSANFGILLAYVFGAYWEYTFTPKFVLLSCILFLCGFAFFPESPSFLLKQNNITEMEKSIRFYRNISSKVREDDEVIQMEITKLKNTIDDNYEKMDQTNSVNCLDFVQIESRRALIIGIGLTVLNQFCGCFAMLNYTSDIFAETGAELNPNVCAILVGTIQLIGCYITTLLVDRAGRKILVIGSAAGTAFGLVCLGSYFLVKSLGHTLEGYGFVPIASFAFTIFMSNLGILSLPFLVIAEIMPEKIKNFGISLCMALVWIFAFVMVKYLPTLTLVLGFHGALFSFAACTLSVAALLLYMMPETKGRSFEEIVQLLRR